MNGDVPARKIGRFGGLYLSGATVWDPGAPPERYCEMRNGVNRGFSPGSACAPQTSTVWRTRGGGPASIGSSSTNGPKSCETSSRRS